MINRKIDEDEIVGVLDEEDMVLMTPLELEKWLNPKEIWLQPWCRQCEAEYEGDGRLWCNEDCWGKCDDCENVAVKYVRIDQ